MFMATKIKISIIYIMFWNIKFTENKCKRHVHTKVQVSGKSKLTLWETKLWISSHSSGYFSAMVLDTLVWTIDKTFGYASLKLVRQVARKKLVSCLGFMAYQTF